jgi:hypothetical protein
LDWLLQVEAFFLREAQMNVSLVVHQQVHLRNRWRKEVLEQEEGQEEVGHLLPSVVVVERVEHRPLVVEGEPEEPRMRVDHPEVALEDLQMVAMEVQVVPEEQVEQLVELELQELEVVLVVLVVHLTMVVLVVQVEQPFVLIAPLVDEEVLVRELFVPFSVFGRFSVVLAVFCIVVVVVVVTVVLLGSVVVAFVVLGMNQIHCIVVMLEEYLEVDYSCFRQPPEHLLKKRQRLLNFENLNHKLDAGPSIDEMWQ